MGLMKINQHGRNLIAKTARPKLSIEQALVIFGRCVTADTNENQANALLSFLICRGEHAFERSILLRLLNNGDYIGASKQFIHWAKRGGKTSRSLLKLRRAEAKLFLRPVLIADNARKDAPPQQ